MRSIAEIDRDFAGMYENCKRQSHGCSYPNCACSQKGVIPVRKQGEPLKSYQLRMAKAQEKKS